MSEDRLLFSREVIENAVNRLARQVDHLFSVHERSVEAWVILNGAFMFAADLLREITLQDFRVKFIQVSSYGDSMESSGEIMLLGDLTREEDCLLIIDDIFDSGRTMQYLRQYAVDEGFSMIRGVTLLEKLNPDRVATPESLQCVTGLQIHRGHFVYGYGMDLQGMYRDRSGIWSHRIDKDYQQGVL